MGTKNIARTAIEGGRAWSNSLARNWSAREERADLRAWLGRAELDRTWAEAVPDPARSPVRKHFHDKLAAPRRWLWSHVGQPWDAVYGEIRRRFDTRTTAGRHIVFDHLLGWVVPHTAVHRLRYHDYLVIDAEGILRPGPTLVRRRRPYALEPGQRWWDTGAVKAWAAGRKIAAQGPHLYWFVASAFTLAQPKAPPRYRQLDRLSADEVRRFRTLSELQRREVDLAPRP